MKQYLLLLAASFFIINMASCKRPPLPPPIVIFDQAHNQTSSIDRNGPADISKLKDLFLSQGFVAHANREPFTAESLNDAAAVIISGPLTPFSFAEIQAIVKYLYEGGQLCLMIEKPSALTGLLSSLQVAVANGTVREQENTIEGNSQNFSLTALPKHPLTKEVASFDIYGAWPLNTALEANVIAKTSKQSWVDLNGDNQLDAKDAMQSFPVLITGQLGHGHFVVFGDDTLLQNRFLSGNNEIMGQNLARWFKEGSYY